MGYHTQIWSCMCIFNQQILTGQGYTGQVRLLPLFVPSHFTSSQWLPTSWRGRYSCSPCDTFPELWSKAAPQHWSGQELKQAVCFCVSPKAALSLHVLQFHVTWGLLSTWCHRLIISSFAVLPRDAPFPCHQVVFLQSESSWQSYPWANPKGWVTIWKYVQPEVILKRTWSHGREMDFILLPVSWIHRTTFNFSALRK